MVTVTPSKDALGFIASRFRFTDKQIRVTIFEQLKPEQVKLLLPRL